ncbi:MAG: rod shape-determining protein RodA, partial [Clostridiales bacterium]|nr:rod shape-determining protein RodA [Clostridiales bacterium]
MGVEVERSFGIDYLKKFDYFLLGIALITSLLGLVFLKSALTLAVDGGSKSMMIQIVGLIIGVLLSLLIGFFDYGNFKNIWLPFLIFNFLVMCLVHVPHIGLDSQNGGHSWINIGFTTYQPSELMKLAMILALAKFLEKADQEGMTVKNAIIILMLYIVPTGMVLLEDDIGTAMVFTFIFLTMLFVGRVKLRYIGACLAAGLACIPFIWKFVLNDTRRNRFFAFLDKDKFTQTYNYQMNKAMIAIGSGQFSGKGLGKGPMNLADIVPIRSSDMIFSVIGEETGFVGCMLVVGLLLVMLARMVYISFKARDLFGSCIAGGIFAMFFFNIFENIGMNIGIMPITGLPLPFISRGGSAMVTNFVAIGLVLSISMRR